MNSESFFLCLDLQLAPCSYKDKWRKEYLYDYSEVGACSKVGKKLKLEALYIKQYYCNDYTK